MQAILIRILVRKLVKQVVAEQIVALVMRSTTTGTANTFIGLNAGSNQITPHGNTAVGWSALQGLSTSTGRYNTALGYAAGSGFSGTANNLSQLSGSYNTFIGYVSSGTASSNTFSNSTAVGAFSQAGANDVMVLGSIAGANNATASTKVGIGTTAPSERLEVQGSVKIVDGTQGATKVLMSDAGGKGAWTDVYGSNIQYAEGTTDVNMNSATFADMPGMTITFTPKHTTVYINVTASGDMDLGGTANGFVKCRVTNSAVSTIYGKVVSIATDQSSSGTVGAWNCSIVCRATGLTVGTSTTIKVQWSRGGNAPRTINCNAASTDYSMRSMMITD
jgi:hypothetical protein